jgi:hypothetical protein
MDKFKPALPVPQVVQNGHVEGLKVSGEPVWFGVDLASAPDLAVDVRRAALEAFAGRVVASLEAGKPVAMRADPFRHHRVPSVGEGWTVYLPLAWLERP